MHECRMRLFTNSVIVSAKQTLHIVVCSCCVGGCRTGPPPRRPPPDLVSVSDIPDDTLRALFKEVQQVCVCVQGLVLHICSDWSRTGCSICLLNECVWPIKLLFRCSLQDYTIEWHSVLTAHPQYGKQRAIAWLTAYTHAPLAAHQHWHIPGPQHHPCAPTMVSNGHSFESFPPQYGVHESVADALHRLSDDALRAVYARASRRLEHLPAAVVKTGAGGRLIVPLPGPRGVPGWDVSGLCGFGFRVL